MMKLQKSRGFLTELVIDYQKIKEAHASALKVEALLKSELKDKWSHDHVLYRALVMPFIELEQQLRRQVLRKQVIIERKQLLMGRRIHGPKKCGTASITAAASKKASG